MHVHAWTTRSRCPPCLITHCCIPAMHAAMLLGKCLTLTTLTELAGGQPLVGCCKLTLQQTGSRITSNFILMRSACGSHTLAVCPLIFKTHSPWLSLPHLLAGMGGSTGVCCLAQTRCCMDGGVPVHPTPSLSSPRHAACGVSPILTRLMQQCPS